MKSGNSVNWIYQGIFVCIPIAVTIGSSQVVRVQGLGERYLFRNIQMARTELGLLSAEKTSQQKEKACQSWVLYILELTIDLIRKIHTHYRLEAYFSYNQGNEVDQYQLLHFAFTSTNQTKYSPELFHLLPMKHQRQTKKTGSQSPHCCKTQSKVSLQLTPCFIL